ncbi:Protein Y72A10A.1, partial [Aphelenchoides avenae]
RLSKHRNLKKLIVHGCRNYEVLQDFRNLPQLLVVKGEIAGLKGMLGDLLDFDNPSLSLHAAHGESSSAAQSEHSSSCNGSSLSAEDDRVMNTPSPITVDSQ